MKDLSQFEVKYADYAGFKYNINQTLDDLSTVQRRLPQVCKKAKILQVEFTYYSYQLKSTGLVTRDFKNKL